MAKTKTTCDVFLSYSRLDASLASEISRIMESYDLKVFSDSELAEGESIENLLWEALAESQAFVTVIPEKELSASMLFELGAAKAWNKPVYAIASDPSRTGLPRSLNGVVAYAPSRIEEIARAIKSSQGSLTDSEKSVLIDEYHRIDVPVDQLLIQPKRLSGLTKQFQKRTKRQITSEELVRMLLRLRKQGALRGDKKKRPKAS